MAFHPWSVPLFVVLVLLALGGVWGLSPNVPAGRRRALLLGGLLTWAPLTVLAWWFNQGEPNYWGEMLFYAAIAILVGTAVVLAILAVVLDHRAGRR